MFDSHIEHLLLLSYTKLSNVRVEKKASEVACALSVVSLLTAMIILISLCRPSSDVVTNNAIHRQILGLVSKRRLLFLGCSCYYFVIVRYGQPVSDLSGRHFCHCLSGLCSEYLSLKSKVLPSGAANCWPRRHSGHIVYIHNGKFSRIMTISEYKFIQENVGLLRQLYGTFNTLT